MRTWLLRASNFILYISFCVMVGTGFIISYRIPPGSRGGSGISVLGWGRHDWGDFHFWVSWVFISFIVLHLFFHWKWLLKIANQQSPLKMVWGLAFGLLIIVFFLFVP